MPSLKTKITATDALVGTWTVLLTSFIVATLYFARELLIPHCSPEEFAELARKN